jgi:hypothetical protein
MRRTRTSLLRCVAMWVAVGILTMSVLGWITSFFRVEWNAPRSVALFNGELIVYDNSSASRSRWHIVGYNSEGSAPRWRWLQIGAPYNGPDKFYIRLPFWMPAATAAVVLAFAWLMGRSDTRRHRAGLCPSCSYDLIGLTGPCPECGSERESKA